MPSTDKLLRECKTGDTVILVPVDGKDNELWELAKAFNELVEVVEEYRGSKNK